MAIEPKLPKYPEAPVKMGHEFFRSIRDRIETVAPAETSATDIVKVKYENDKGCIISLRIKEITMTVCSNGAPFDIKVLQADVPPVKGKGGV